MRFLRVIQKWSSWRCVFPLAALSLGMVVVYGWKPTLSAFFRYVWFVHVAFFLVLEKVIQHAIFRCKSFRTDPILNISSSGWLSLLRQQLNDCRLASQLLTLAFIYSPL